MYWFDKQILRQIADLSAKFGTTVEIHGEAGYITAQRQPHIDRKQSNSEAKVARVLSLMEEKN